jgi:hypothetical protein
MPRLRLAPVLPLLGSTLALMFVLGGAQAALYQLTTPRPRTEADRQFVQCSTALALLRQERDQEALALLKGDSHAPMPLTQDSSLNNELTPGTQVLQLGLKLVKAAREADAQGQPVAARAYLAQCSNLEHRIRVTPQPSGTPVEIARTMKNVVRRAEIALNR